MAHTPVALGFAILQPSSAVDLYYESDKLDRAVLDHLGDDVRVHPPIDFIDALSEFSEKRVGVERKSAPVAVSSALAGCGAETVWATDPCSMPKACKNAAEKEGTRKAHLRDGAAMARFLCWFCLLYTSPSPRDRTRSRMPSSA